MQSILLGVGALIAFTQACIAFAVFRYSRRQQFVDRGTQRIIRIHDWGNDCIDALSEAGQFCLLQRPIFPIMVLTRSKGASFFIDCRL